MLKFGLVQIMCLAAALPGGELKAQSGDQQESDSPIQWGVQAGAGYFNFRNSLYVEVGPDPPGNLSEDWYEFYFKPWASFEWDTEFGTWFGKASWVYARTGRDASEISDGGRVRLPGNISCPTPTTRPICCACTQTHAATSERACCGSISLSINRTKPFKYAMVYVVLHY